MLYDNMIWILKGACNIAEQNKYIYTFSGNELLNGRIMNEVYMRIRARRYLIIDQRKHNHIYLSTKETPQIEN